MTASRPPPTATRLLLVLLLTALAVGAAASVIAAARYATSPPPTTGGSTELYPTGPVIVLAAVLLFLAIVVPLIYDRIRGGRAMIPGRAVAVTVVVVLAMVVFVVIARYTGFAGGGFPETPGNATGTGNATHIDVNNSTNPIYGNGGTLKLLSLQIPAWVIFPILAIGALLVAFVGVPRVREYLADRASARASPSGEELEVRSALSAASQELAQGGDARTVILRLYARLLERVGPLAGNVDSQTPEEIRSLHLLRLGIRRSSADQLTRLFEEARYSTHALGPAASERAARAVADAERDLERSEPLA